MNPYLLGFLTGVMVAVVLITALLYALAFKWNASYAKSLSISAASFVIAAGVSAFGAANGGPPNFGAAPYYFAAQALVLTFDLFRIHRKLGK